MTSNRDNVRAATRLVHFFRVGVRVRVRVSVRVAVRVGAGVKG